MTWIELLQRGRRLVPRPLRERLRHVAFDWFDLAWTRPSGVTLRVRNSEEWIIYNEIFVDGEYDRAIDLGLASRGPGQPFTVVDLGANVGFFTLRVVDRLANAGADEPRPSITAVEGHPHLAIELGQRLFVDNRCVDLVSVVSGLVGETSGTGTLSSSISAPGTSSMIRQGSGPRFPVAFVNLDELSAATAGVDLLKCDVEGAELRVIECAPGLLAKTRVAVFELHADLCDVDRCRQLMRRAGFVREELLRERDGHALYAFARL